METIVEVDSNIEMEVDSVNEEIIIDKKVMETIEERIGDEENSYGN